MAKINFARRNFSSLGNVAVHFVGMNASAATIASLDAKHISIDAASKEFTASAEDASVNKNQAIIEYHQPLHAEFSSLSLRSSLRRTSRTRGRSAIRSHNPGYS